MITPLRIKQKIQLAFDRKISFRDWRTGRNDPRVMMSFDTEENPDIWWRLPRWISWPILRIWMRKFK